MSDNRFNIKRIKRVSPSRKSVGSEKRPSDVVSNGSHMSGKINFHRIQQDYMVPEKEVVPLRTKSKELVTSKSTISTIK